MRLRLNRLLTWRGVTWALLPMIALVASGTVSFAAHSASAQVQPTNQLLYLVPLQPAHLKQQPFSPAQWQAHGVQLVHTFTDLRALTSPATAAVIVDGELFSQVDQGWLRAQLTQRRVVVGVNVNLNELEAALGDPQLRVLPNGRPFPGSERAPYWRPNEPIFSPYAKGARPGHRCESLAQDPFRIWDLDGFLVQVSEAVDCAKLTLTS